MPGYGSPPDKPSVCPSQSETSGDRAYENNLVGDDLRQDSAWMTAKNNKALFITQLALPIRKGNTPDQVV